MCAVCYNDCSAFANGKFCSNWSNDVLFNCKCCAWSKCVVCCNECVFYVDCCAFHNHNNVARLKSLQRCLYFRHCVVLTVDCCCANKTATIVTFLVGIVIKCVTKCWDSCLSNDNFATYGAVLTIRCTFGCTCCWNTRNYHDICWSVVVMLPTVCCLCPNFCTKYKFCTNFATGNHLFHDLSEVCIFPKFQCECRHCYLCTICNLEICLKAWIEIVSCEVGQIDVCAVCNNDCCICAYCQLSSNWSKDICCNCKCCAWSKCVVCCNECVLYVDCCAFNNKNGITRLKGSQSRFRFRHCVVFAVDCYRTNKTATIVTFLVGIVVECVTKCWDYCLSKNYFVAYGTVLAFGHTFGCTCCRYTLECDNVVTSSSYVVANVTIATYGTIVGCKSLFGTSCACWCCHVVVAKCRNYFRFLFATNTNTFLQTVIGTIWLCDYSPRAIFMIVWGKLAVYCACCR